MFSAVTADSLGRLIMRLEPTRLPRAFRPRQPMMMTTTDRKTVSIPRACELVGVSRRTIYNWMAGRKVEYVRTAGGSVRIFVDTLWREPGAAPEEAAAPAEVGWHEGLRRGA